MPQLSGHPFFVSEAPRKNGDGFRPFFALLARRTSDRRRKSEKAPPRAPQRADAGPALACRLALALPAPPRGQDFDWATYEANRSRIAANAHPQPHHSGGAVREGSGTAAG